MQVEFNIIEDNEDNEDKGKEFLFIEDLNTKIIQNHLNINFFYKYIYKIFRWISNISFF